ncbi:hypothetical protein LGH82_01180 [Mesorhizobium sp. PAMC28654]|uniref:hypothetical protein n=1 Tax=Mesorhizobium sp. PAMC28654 TaxID=2880934 RepID=UPI001D0AE3DA|nr:hypothetical protein [Mesorhizobium sp. PAMC28654]UDL90052.1 hypothetical protein LGH82_01180 [Mesorhizobium sp. PAMC28654]
MTLRLLLCPIALGFVLAATAAALAAPECLANGKSFQLGQSACLTLAGESHLARCDKVLNNSSWTKVADNCPGEAPATHPTAPLSTPLPKAIPAEPTAN